MQHVRTSVALALALSATACVDSTEPASANATVRVTADTVVVTRAVTNGFTWIRFSVPVTVTNEGSVFPIEQPACSFTVEAFENQDWHRAYSPVCILSGAVGDRTIPPGSTREFTMTVFTGIDGQNPDWKASGVEGTYRMAVGVHNAARSGAIPFLRTNSFRLRE